MNEKAKSTWKYLLGFVFLAVLIFWMIVFREQIDSLKRLSTKLEGAEATVSALTATQQALVTEMAFADSDQAVEEWAYRHKKWVRDGDKRIAVIPEEGTPLAPTPTPVPTQEPANNFQLWWELFFRSSP
jgi:cell division protein FtsB